MAGRSRLPPHLHRHLDDPLHLPPPRHHPAVVAAALEDRLDAQHRDIRTLLHDNDSLAATHVALKQELASSQHRLHLALETLARTKAHKDAQVREVYERCIRVEEEVRVLDSMRVELVQVKADVGKLGQVKEEMQEKVKELKVELEKAKGEMERTEAVKADTEIMKKELERGRLAVEFEKKAHADNLEHKQSIENNMLYLTGEAEKLRAELANREKRSRAAAVAAAVAAEAANPGHGYAETHGTNAMIYGASAYAGIYSSHQLQGGVSGSSQYGSTAVPHSSYNAQQ